ncbi:MAG: alpha/beta hydrolase fold domain-containing protein [Paracoccaceae bacterium]
MSFRKILAVGALLLGATSVQAHDEFLDVPYGDHERQVLDVFMPDGVENPPVVLFIFGGRWLRDDKTEVHDYRRLFRMNQAGIAVVSMNHRYSTDEIWPAQKDDVEAVLRFIHANAGTYGYDSSRLAVWGQSSGAHLALWSGVMSAQDPDLGVDAVVSWFSPTNLSLLWEDRENDEVPGANERMRDPTPEAQLLGVSAREDKAAGDAASPDVQASLLPADAVLPPTFLVHGDRDNQVSPLQSERVHEIFSARGAKVELMMIQGGAHGGPQFDRAVMPSIEWIVTHFEGN